MSSNRGSSDAGPGRSFDRDLEDEQPVQPKICPFTGKECCGLCPGREAKE